jgi:hypothetical protein
MVTEEQCPHCGQALDLDSKLGYRHARIIHLVEHGLQAALGLSLRDVPDRSFWEAAEACAKDTWADAALAAHDELLEVIDSLGILLDESAQDRAESQAVGWLNSHYPSALADH